MTTPLVFKPVDPTTTLYGGAAQSSTYTLDWASTVLVSSNTPIDYNQIFSRPWLSAGVDPTANVYKTTGYVGIGSTPVYPLDVQAAVGGISLRSTGQILAANFVGTSDIRAKENIISLSSSNSFQIINSVNVVKYDFIDGLKSQVGFIAQEVESLVPEAIIQIEEFLPTIFKFMDIEIANDCVVVDKLADIVIGDQIKVLISNKIPAVLTVVEGILDTKTYLKIPCGVSLVEGPLFVYGKKVPDFRIINKDVLYAHSIGAIQELSRRVALLELK